MVRRRGAKRGSDAELDERDTRVASNALGMTRPDLILALGQGISMLTLSDEHGVDPDRIVDALIDDHLLALANRLRGVALESDETRRLRDAIEDHAMRVVYGFDRHSAGPPTSDAQDGR